MLLLFGLFDGEKPMGIRTYRSLRKMLEVLGPGDPEGDVTREALIRLGQTPAEAASIAEKLRQEYRLDRHLDTLSRLGISVATRISPEYPARLREALGDRTPMLLYWAGNPALFQTECVSLVGSRKLREPGRRFAAAAGRAAAEQGLTYVSGGAAGADTAGFEAAMAAKGTAVLFLADSLQRRMETLRQELETGRVLLVSRESYDLPFSVSRAYDRNDLIHAMGRKVLVAQSDYGAGGTWQGVMENLKHGWSPVFVWDGTPEEPGTRGLLERGCAPVSMEDLRDLRALKTRQTSLFE